MVEYVIVFSGGQIETGHLLWGLRRIEFFNNKLQ